MFDQISNPSIDIYNGINGQFVGEASFTLTEESEKALLQLVNYNVMPEKLTLMNLDFYQPSENYSPPTTTAPIQRASIIRAIFRDSVNGFQVPYEIRMRYLVRARDPGINPYFFTSVEYTNIIVDSAQRVSY